MSMDERRRVGFIGTGTMGEPMARNLVRAGTSLVVWNRTTDKTHALAAAGAHVASNVAEVFEHARVVVLMLTDSVATDAVLARGTSRFAEMARDRTIIQMGTGSPVHSLALARDIASAGGRYIEAPVSGQRGPAETGQLVAMVSGDERDLDEVKPLLDLMCRDIVRCGPVPNALSLKLASNLFVGTMLSCLAETFNYARCQGLDLGLLASLLSNGPMASDLVRMKAPKLVARDFAVQASIDNLTETTRLIAEQAETVHAATPMLQVCASLCREAAALGIGQADVSALMRVFQERSQPA